MNICAMMLRMDIPGKENILILKTRINSGNEQENVQRSEDTDVSYAYRVAAIYDVGSFRH